MAALLSSPHLAFPRGIFKSDKPAERARAIVKAVTHYKDAKILAEVSENIGEAHRCTC